MEALKIWIPGLLGPLLTAGMVDCREAVTKAVPDRDAEERKEG